MRYLSSLTRKFEVNSLRYLRQHVLKSGGFIDHALCIGTCRDDFELIVAGKFYAGGNEVPADALASKTRVNLGMVNGDLAGFRIKIQHTGETLAIFLDIKLSLFLDFLVLNSHTPSSVNIELIATQILFAAQFSIILIHYEEEKYAVGNRVRALFAGKTGQILRHLRGGKMTKIYDVTVAISAETPIYKGDPGVEITAFKSIAVGASANVSKISFGVHTATHVDAPNHFIDGAKRIHELDPEKLVGPCRVIQVPDKVVAIEPEHVGDISGVTRVLFKTQNSAFWATPELGFRTDFSYLTPETARLLVDKGVVLVGIDYLSIEKSGSPGHPVHITLLENEVVILEGLDLREVLPGDYGLICMPLKYIGGGGDGSPARTMLWKN